MAGRCFWSKTNEESGDFNRGRFIKNCRVHLMEKINKLGRFMAIENKFYIEGTVWSRFMLLKQFMVTAKNVPAYISCSVKLVLI